MPELLRQKMQDNEEKFSNMNEQVTRYISEAPEAQRKNMETLRKIIHKEVPSVTENFKWGRPVFSDGSDFIYFKSAKAYLTLGFFKAGKLKNNTQLLEGTGKDMRHIKIRELNDDIVTIITQWIHQLIR